MIRFVLNFLGALFSFVTTGAIFAALSIGAVFWVFSRDLPSHEQLATYTPKMISRIYSGEGRLIDERSRKLLGDLMAELRDEVRRARA